MDRRPFLKATLTTSALAALGRSRLDPEVAAATMGAAVKYREDAERVRVALDRMLAG